MNSQAHIVPDGGIDREMREEANSLERAPPELLEAIDNFDSDHASHEVVPLGEVLQEEGASYEEIRISEGIAWCRDCEVEL